MKEILNMESNLKNIDVCTSKCLFLKEVELPIDTDFTLPDYYSAINSILCCKTEPAVSSKSYTGNTAKIDGVIGVKLLYKDDSGELCSFESGSVFTKNIDTGILLENKIIKACITDNSLNFSVKNERKFCVKGTVTITISIYEIIKNKCLCNSENDDFQIKTTDLPVKKSILYAEKNIIIEDDLSLSDSHAKIGKIVNYIGTIIPDECKIMNGKVMIKGTLCVNITYLSSRDAKACHIQHKIPYSQICDIEKLEESYTCVSDENLIFLEVRCRNSGNDESHTFTINAKINIELEAYLLENQSVITDIYSTKYDTCLKDNMVESNRLIDSVTEVFSAKKSLEFTDGCIGSVTDIWSDVKITGKSIKDNCITVFGIAYIKLLICNKNSEAEYLERAIDFEYKYNYPVSLENCDIDIKLYLSNLSYIIVSETCIEVLCDMTVKINIYENTKYSVISEIEISADKKMKQSNSSLYICYLEKERDLWELAKEHRSSVKEIIELNSLDENQEKVCGAILISVE